MAGSESSRRPAPARPQAAVAEYRRTLRQVAALRVVDEAEDILARAWISELDELRRAALGRLAAARMAQNAARIELRRAEEYGRPEELVLAHARMQSTEAVQAGDLTDARAFIASVDAELELLWQAGIERARRDRAEHARLRSAWRAVYRSEAPADGAEPADADGRDLTDPTSGGADSAGGAGQGGGV